MRCNKNAFVLIFVLTILALVTLLTHQLMRLVHVGSHFDRTMVDRERAEMLALGGIKIAMAALTQKSPGKKKEKLSEEETKKKKKKELETFLQHILPHLGLWQTFDLRDEIDGIDGELKLCITCEEGKININEAFDFKKKEFKPIYKKLLQRVKFKGKNAGPFLKKLAQYLKKRGRKIDDISELQAGTGGIISQIFYEPPKPSKKPKQAKPNEVLALQDIFTIWTDSDKLEALFLSDGMRAMLGFTRPKAHDAKLKKEIFKKVIKNFDAGTDQNSEKYWKIVRPLYQPKSSFKIQNTKIFSSTFEPKIYSVLSSGKVGNVEQRVLAVIKEVLKQTKKADKKKKAPKAKQTKQEKEKKQEQTPTKQTKEFKIVRLYWI